jgi:signal transduction histidine kinase
MTIKSRLFIAFAIFITIVVLVSTVLVTFGLKNSKLSEETLYQYSQVVFWQELYQNFDSQLRSLNYFIILGDQKEREKFKEQTKSILKNEEGSDKKSVETLGWFKRYKAFTNSAEDDIDNQSRSRLFDTFADRLSSEGGELKKDIAQQIGAHTGALNTLESTNKNLNRFSLVFSIVTGFLAIAVGVLMSLLIFRSISKPLNILEKGAKIIGEGNLDFQIPIKSKDEIGRVAESFNQMVSDLRNLQLQIIQMDRMSSIGQLAGGVAHEINNPLTGVLGQAQLLLEKLPLDNPYRNSIERIEVAAQRCRRIVRSLLDFARDKNYRFVTTDLNKLLDETLDFTKTEMDSKNIQLVKDVAPDVPSLKLSYGHIQQVFINIISNSIQAMPNGGKLLISAKKKNSSLEISFKDSGIGIKREDINHVFDPFFTTKDIGQGTGLGLTVSYGIVQKHMGEIIAESEGEGKGATFTIRLPLKQNG